MRRGALLVLSLFALAACGRTSGTVEIPLEDLPFPVARVPTPAVTEAPTRTFPIYFTRDGRLARVTREIKADVGPAEAALRALLEGPSAAERAQMIASQLPVAVRLLDLRVDAETIRVDLSGEFEEPAPSELIILRVAQVVWTLTEIPEFRAVAFAIDGEDVAVTTVDGSAVGRPVTRVDYEALSPP